MTTVTVDREFDAPPQRVRSVFGDAAAYFDAVGFDVERDGDRLELTKRVALATVTLDVTLRSTEEVALAYEQVAGPFETMTAEYAVDTAATGSTLRIETSFDSPAVGIGAFLNRATVRRQRRAELDVVGGLLAPAGESSTTSSRVDTVGVGVTE
jgi:hypothetical protein